jgi:hypothetical protein
VLFVDLPYTLAHLASVREDLFERRPLAFLGRLGVPVVDLLRILDVGVDPSLK